jgi:serine/threonine-protein kinase
VQSSGSSSDRRRPATIGAYTVRADIGRGRFGPVYRGHDPATDQPVVIRIFTDPMGAQEQARLMAALNLLCDTPLDHRSIARPLATGIEDGQPFLVHTLLPGVPLDAFLAEHGPQPLADAVLRVTQLAAAIDFAAAAGVHHGSLRATDVILGPDSAGISGFGLAQAMHAAGLDWAGDTPSWSHDVSALAALAFELLYGHRPDEGPTALPSVPPGADALRLQQVFDDALSPAAADRPVTALGFAAALQAAIVDAQVAPTETVPIAAPQSYAAAAVADGDDLTLRPDTQSLSEFLPELPIGTREPVSMAAEEPADAPATDIIPTRVKPAAAVPWEPPPARRLPTPAEAEDVLRAQAAAARPAERVRTADDLRPPAADSRSLFAAVPEPARQSGGGGWLFVAAALVIGIMGGFVGGYVAGQSGEPLPLPEFAARVVRLPGAAATTGAAEARGTGEARDASGAVDADRAAGEGRQEAANGSQPPSGAADAGRADSGAQARIPESPVPAPDAGVSNAQPPAPSPASPAPGSDSRAPSTEARVQNPEPRVPPPAPRLQGPESAAPGSMQVLSRPAGAQVYVDGSLVGRTPVIMSALAPGRHDVRIELDGHRRWATNVLVEPGERARVAASLEQ